MADRHATTSVTTGSDLAGAIGAAIDDRATWTVVGSPRAADVVIELGGPLAELAMLGDAQVQVGGGVRLDTLSQYVQSQTGVAPGWPIGTAVTVVAALSGHLPTGHPALAVVRQMSHALVEVEVARGSTRATELWDPTVLVADDGTIQLPSDAAVVAVTVGLAAAADAVRAAARPGVSAEGPRVAGRG